MRHSPLTQALLLLTLTAPVAAQNAATSKPEAPAPVADTALAPPTAVPLPEVPTRAEQVNARMEEIRQVLPQDRATIEVENAYRAAQDTITALMRIQSRPDQERPTKRSLTDLHNEWARRIGQMRGWQKTVSQRMDVLTSIQGELARRQKSWELTRADAAASNAPADIRALIDGVLQGTGELEDSVAARVSKLIQLQSHVARTITSIQQADNEANDQLASMRHNLLRLDSPPLWKGLQGADTAQGLLPTVKAGFARTRRELGFFVEAYRVPIYFHLASTLGILLAVFWFRGKLERHTSEQPAASARRVLSYPGSSSALIIALAVLVFYPRAPLSVYDLALLVTVVPVLRLLPSFLPPFLLRPARAGALLFAVQRIGALLIADSIYQRPGSLLVSLAGAAGLFWLLRAGGEFERLGNDGYSRALRAAARLSAAALAVASVSNVAGNVSLALFLSYGTLTSSYLLLVVLTAVRVFDGMLIVLTRSEVAGVSRFVAQRKDDLVRGGLRLVHFLAAVGWFLITLVVFDLIGPTEALVARVLGASFRLGELHLSLGAALLFVATVWASVLIGRALSSLLEVDVLSRLDMPRGLPNVIGRLTRYALITIGFLFALAAIGVELTQLAILGGALGVGIGFGLQNVVGNFVAGLILAFERPIREGDLVQLGDLTGEVRRIGFRATLVRTYDGAEVIVPNGSLISNDLINWTLSDQKRRLTVEVGVAYGTDPARVLELLREVPARHPTILKEPAPLTLFTGFGDSSLNFELRFWIADISQLLAVKSEVTTAINDALAAAGIEIPFPQRDLHLRSVDAAAAERLGRTPPAAKETP